MNPKPGKDAPKPQNKGQSQSGVTQNNTTNPKKDTGKWCEFHNNPTQSTNECRAKQSLVAELKAPELDACSNPEVEPGKGDEKGNNIIYVDPSAIVSTTKLQMEDPKGREEGEHLFHSQMWVKGSPLQYLVDSRSQKNLISVEVVNLLNLPTIVHP